MLKYFKRGFMIKLYNKKRASAIKTQNTKPRPYLGIQKKYSIKTQKRIYTIKIVKNKRAPFNNALK